MPPALSATAARDADARDPASPICFSVLARVEPGVMPRVIELFAKRGLVPLKWHSTATGEVLTIEVQIGGIGRDVADYIARCMRQIIGVQAVLMSENLSSG